MTAAQQSSYRSDLETITRRHMVLVYFAVMALVLIMQLATSVIHKKSLTRVRDPSVLIVRRSSCYTIDYFDHITL